MTLQHARDGVAAVAGRGRRRRRLLGLGSDHIKSWMSRCLQMPAELISVGNAGTGGPSAQLHRKAAVLPQKAVAIWPVPLTVMLREAVDTTTPPSLAVTADVKVGVGARRFTTLSQ